MDLRSERTIKWIEDIFVELTLTEGFSRVTVSEIANKAQINRKTFYAHYLDKYDLAQKLAVQVLKRYKLLLDQRLIGTNIRLNSLIDSFLKKKENVRLLKALFTIHTEEFDFEEEFSKLLVSQFEKARKSNRSIRN
ncbi:TetR/AcrR family transcriptional regulator [Sporolactobacillus terrae]|uniref:TetR/AcrR family transcriptional regulator n=1 Tax=Sporolactobacillus terrae TaxID=269673 RepID=UPI000683E5E2|nr:TetR family transcriptional regulator [Sporolactobacillus terrae]